MKQTYRTCEVFQKINNWLDNHAYFTVTVVIILGSISVLGLTLMEHLKNIKCNIVKSVVCVILSVSLIGFGKSTSGKERGFQHFFSCFYILTVVICFVDIVKN